ncbi:MAG: 3-dehydroquinate synthase [Clostridiales bacterium]|nr:3-dehydroquinate synthase [Clostridiales bacterium]
MIKTKVKASRNYTVITGRRLIGRTGKLIEEIRPFAKKILIVSESRVAPLYLARVKASCMKAGFEVYAYVFEAGERSKNIDTIAGMWSAMAQEGFTRTDLIVALGGGVCGDMAGFAASTFLRGIDFIQIPTSLLAMVDASIGGKTGIDLPEGKNQVGAFWQPSLVIEDISCLDTLPDEVFIEGMAEVIKYAFIMDIPLYKLLRENSITALRSDPALLEKMVGMCVKDKAYVIQNDEHDNGLRQTLNYGHTVGHVIEKNSNFSLPHGVCVAKGMGIMINACEKNSTLSSEDAMNMKDLIRAYNLPVDDDITPEQAVAGAMNDKKKRGSILSVILVNKIGHSQIKKMTHKEYLEFLR